MHGLECGHLFCRQCWDKYLRVMVMDEGKAQVCNNLHHCLSVCQTHPQQRPRKLEIDVTLTLRNKRRH